MTSGLAGELSDLRDAWNRLKRVSVTAVEQRIVSNFPSPSNFQWGSSEMDRRELTAAAEGEPTPGDETSLVLLDQAQAYLRSILQDNVPNSKLCESWSEFYRIYNELIRRYVIARQVPANDIDDCIQEVWTAIARHLTDFEHPRDRPGLRAWLYQVVRSKAADVMRKRQKCAPTSLERLSEIHHEPTTSDDAVAVWRQLFLEAVLAEVLTQESLENRQIMTLRLVENYSSQEIADQVGLSVRIIRYRINSVRQRLRERIAFYSGETVEADSATSESSPEN